MAKILKILLVLFIILLIALASFGGYFFIKFNEAPSSWSEDHHLLIEEGMTISSVGRDLENKELIGSYYLFRIYHEIFGRNDVIPTGSYTLSAGSTTVQVYQKLVSGIQDMITVTIPEGWTASAVASRLDSFGICSEEEFMSMVNNQKLLSSYGLISDSFEGYLYPDTYRFVYGESAENVLSAMVENFFYNLSQVYPDWKDLTDTQLRDKVIMASIVEKEYRQPDEAPLIASVFYNRLDNPNFPLLQSCATVVYVITDIMKNPHPDRLLYRDLAIKNPYNTYYAEGLPPGAIANPGLTALGAAFNPAETDYIFFVVKDSRVGSHNFSSNYSAFLDDKDNYLESFRSK